MLAFAVAGALLAAEPSSPPPSPAAMLQNRGGDRFVTVRCKQAAGKTECTLQGFTLTAPLGHESDARTLKDALARKKKPADRLELLTFHRNNACPPDDVALETAAPSVRALCVCDPKSEKCLTEKLLALKATLAKTCQLAGFWASTDAYVASGTSWASSSECATRTLSQEDGRWKLHVAARAASPACGEAAEAQAYAETGVQLDGKTCAAGVELRP